jgi:hypothetical protein
VKVPKNIVKSLLLLGLSLTAFASDKALLIGIGRYADPNANLPGIDLDVQHMREIAMSIGIRDIRTLQDEQATMAGIQNELRGWFREGVTRDDRLLLYFSSHGSLVNGPNGLVGAIIPHDFRREPGTLTNVLTGPMLVELLSGNPSRRIFLVVDACHSGGLTSSKGVGLAFYPKFLRYEGMPEGDLTGGLVSAGMPATKGIAVLNYGYLAACQRDQVAAATSQGSVLTLGLADALKELHRSQKSASLVAVTPMILRFIQTGGINAQNPELFGDGQLLHADWLNSNTAAPPPSPPPPSASQNRRVWESLENIAQHSTGSLNVRASRGEYVKNDLLELSMNVPRDGYLFVVTAGEGDEKPTVLFPNKWEQDNHVSGGSSIKIPRSGAKWHIRQGLTAGMKQQNVLVVVLLSNSPDSLKDFTSGGGAFKDLDIHPESTRTPFAEEASSAEGFLAGKVTFVIKDDQ